MSWPRTMPKMAMTATAMKAIRPNTLVMPSSSRCSGERDRLVAVTIPAIWPISVALPVAVTTNAVVPRVTWVFWNTRLVRSPSAHLAVGQGHRVLGHRRALTGQRGFLHLQRGRGDDPPVRRDHVTGLQQDDVARHQLGRVDLLDLARSPHPGAGHLELRQRLHTGPGLQLLIGAHHHVEQHQPQHHQRRGDLNDREAGHHHHQQHDVHRVDQLRPRHHPHARRRLLGQLVWPVLSQPLLRVCGRQPFLDMDTYLRGHILRRQRVPCRPPAGCSPAGCWVAVAVISAPQAPSAPPGLPAGGEGGSVSTRSPGRR